MGMGTWGHETILPAEPESASRAREFVRQHLVDHELVPLVDDVQLVASELTTNAVMHARSPVTVRLALQEGALRIAVADSAPAIPAACSAQPLDTHGRGLFIVDCLTEHWGVTAEPDGAKTVWATFPTPAAG